MAAEKLKTCQFDIFLSKSLKIFYTSKRKLESRKYGKEKNPV